MAIQRRQPNSVRPLNAKYGTKFAFTPTIAGAYTYATTTRSTVGGCIAQQFSGGTPQASYVKCGVLDAADTLTTQPGWLLIKFNPGPSASWHATSNYIANKSDNNTNRGWTLYHLNNGTLTMKLVGASNSTTVTGSGVIKSSTDQVIIVRYNGISGSTNSTQLWVDGVNQTGTSSASGARVSDASQNLYIGSGIYGASADSVGSITLFAAGTGWLTDGQVRELFDFPFSVYENTYKADSRNLLFPASAVVGGSYIPNIVHHLRQQGIA